MADTKFPYTKAQNEHMGPPGGGMSNGGSGGMMMQQGGMPPNDGIVREEGTNNTGSESSTTYQTVQDYIAALNKTTKWVNYDIKTNTVTISSVADFVNSQKNPSKSVGAFDNVTKTQGENDLFGNDVSDSLHFDSILTDLLIKNQATYAAYSDWKVSYITDYATDLTAIDKLGMSIQDRMNVYNPMYYLSSYYPGFETSTPAKYWRIRTGIKQGDTASTVEMNLALALQGYMGVDMVDFATIWDQAHTKAERTGDSDGNFITWVTEIAKK